MRVWRTRVGCHITTLVLVLSAGGAPVVAQTDPEISITRENDTSVVVGLDELDSDRRFLGAVNNGFPLYIEFHIELRESRGIWFDRSAAEHVVEYVVSFDPVRDVYVVDDQLKTEELRTEAQLQGYLQRHYRAAFDLPPPGRYYYAVTVDARTLSDADVDEVYDWLRGDDGEPPQRRGILTRAARRLLIEVAPLPRWTGRVETDRFDVR